MSDGNGNGNQKPLRIDVTNDAQFKVDVATTLQLIADRTECLPDIKKKVEKHDRIYQYGKWSAVPVVAALHGFVDHALKLLKW